MKGSPKEGQSTLGKNDIEIMKPQSRKVAGKHFASGGLIGGQEVGEKRKGENRNKPLSHGYHPQDFDKVRGRQQGRGGRSIFIIPS